AHYKTSKSDHNEEKVVPLMAGMSLLAQPYENRYDVIFSGSSATSSRMQTHLWYITKRSEERKKNALLARTLVRTTVARYQTNNNNDTVVDPRSLKFKKNLYGKPEVDGEVDTTTNYPKLKFNISHTDSLIACGVTVNVPVGIDVEDKTRKMRHDVLSLAKRFYSSREVEFLSSIADMEARRKEFIKLWTLKEAYVKALGKGFSLLHLLILSQSSGLWLLKATIFAARQRDGSLGFWTASSHYAAICIEGEDDEEEAMTVIVHRTIPFNPTFTLLIF
ncbi:LOW QUALITY PROTEIN: hypothetical protein HID58_069176, partial [Brassica napus]